MPKYFYCVNLISTSFYGFDFWIFLYYTLIMPLYVFLIENANISDFKSVYGFLQL